MNTLDYAKSWVNFGVTPIPLAPRSKIPILKWSRWTDRLPSIEIIEKWFDQKYKRNIALCCGMNNLTVIDIDDMGALPRWKESLSMLWQKILDNTYQVKTNRGIHFYLRTFEQEKSRSIPGIDVKASHSIVVSPPSIHPSGAIYTDNNNHILTVETTLDILPYPEYLYERCKQEIIVDDWCVEDEHSLQDIKVIKSKIGIIDILCNYTKLHRTSSDGRWWMGKCPWPTHRDIHPSFRVDTKTNRCKCLSGSCPLHYNRGLDILDFYCIMNNATLKDAIKEYSRYC